MCYSNEMFQNLPECNTEQYKAFERLKSNFEVLKHEILKFFIDKDSKGLFNVIIESISTQSEECQDHLSMRATLIVNINIERKFAIYYGPVMRERTFSKSGYKITYSIHRNELKFLRCDGIGSKIELTSYGRNGIEIDKQYGSFSDPINIDELFMSNDFKSNKINLKNA